MTPVLAVVPCRGGSKRLPHKWAQTIGGKPLLQWTIDTARAVHGVDRLVVCTEDDTIASYAQLRGVEVVRRRPDLAADHIPIADVTKWVVNELGWDGTVMVLQPTCPLLTPDTVERVMRIFADFGCDWLITTSKDPHIFWQHGIPVVPREQSQELERLGLDRETGAVQIMTARFARFGEGIRNTVAIPAGEALDIDTAADLEVARAAVARKTILFHVVASDQKGSGHLRRCLQLTDALAHHRVVWSQTLLEGWARAEAAAHGVTFVDYDKRLDADLVVVDALDAADYIVPYAAAEGIPTVVFEHEGRGARYADLVLDEFADPAWTILRPEFLCLPPYQVVERAEKVLVTFGGTDPTGMNGRVSRILRHGADGTVLVAGQELRGSMAEWMRWADLVVTSQGRTVHEAAACGVPCVSIAVNERESRHARLPGVVYLGLSATLSDAAILDAVNRLLGSVSLRREMSTTSSASIDGRGLRRVVRRIEDLLEGVA